MQNYNRPACTGTVRWLLTFGKTFYLFSHINNPRSHLIADLHRKRIERSANSHYIKQYKWKLQHGGCKSPGNTSVLPERSAYWTCRPTQRHCFLCKAYSSEQRMTKEWGNVTTKKYETPMTDTTCADDQGNWRLRLSVWCLCLDIIPFDFSQVYLCSATLADQPGLKITWLSINYSGTSKQVSDLNSAKVSEVNRGASACRV